ncbi:hypothetical protein DFH11DRAFT_1589929 [Phellopilus nigrolimitatus]|nr:hypothetical protein DFH11DRAFT_1589929 [Phellopilus nigrolimitatus]
MSRLIVKNLPLYVTTVRLKDHFLQKDGPGGTLTDIKVAQKPDGTSRRFAFVGFKNDEEAKRAQEWFDRTYIDTTRINVQVAEKGAKDAPAPRPNKKLRLGPSPTDEQPGSSSRSKKTRAEDTAPDDTIAPLPSSTSKGKKAVELEEFMQVMQPRTKKERTWANNDVVPEPSSQVSTNDDALEQSKPLTTSDDAGQSTVEELDDLEWMKRRMTKGFTEGDDEKIFEQEDEDGDEGGSRKGIKLGQPDAAGKREFDEPSPADTILQSGRLFLRNLSYSCTQSDIQAYFTPCGTISQVHIPLDPVSKSSKGLAFVTFSDPTSALKAYEELDKTSFQGRLLHILPAVERKVSGMKGVEESNDRTNLKKDKEKKRKENAGKEFNWSMLYMNSDAVASSIADRMNIPKADILNPDSSDGDSTSAAVKLALAETHIIQETKAYLESEGINLSSFSSLESSDRAVRTRRLDTCILVKNIPYGTTADQIREMFEPHGKLSRVLVPPAGTIAVVEFVHADEAAKGFRAVAYRRMGSSIIYLEKAPIGIFTGVPRDKDERRVSMSAAKTRPAVSSQQDTEMLDTNDEAEAAPGSTLFVKNLSFATTSERLTAVFRHLPSFAFARVQTKPDPKHPAIPGQPATRLSMGFGFVGFTAPDAAKKALLSMQGFVLDGHTLSVKFSGRGADDEKPSTEEKGSAKAKTTKMVVKNVPFETTKKDLRALFGAHGQLKSVRLPKKFDARARGFAFLDFATRHEAENAYAALRHTHLLGRHLVLEWAEDTGQDVDALRKKAGVGFGDGAELPGRKRKLDLGEDDDDGQEE